MLGLTPRFFLQLPYFPKWHETCHCTYPEVSYTWGTLFGSLCAQLSAVSCFSSWQHQLTLGFVQQSASLPVVEFKLMSPARPGESSQPLRQSLWAITIRMMESKIRCSASTIIAVRPSLRLRSARQAVQ